MTELVAPPPAIATETWTYEKYARVTAEGEWFTIIGGEKITPPSRTTLHQSILGNLCFLLNTWAKQTHIGQMGLGPLDVVFTETDVVQPDIIFILDSHSDRWATTHINGAPDMIVEIVSPSTIRLDRVKKRALYAQHGVPEYWIVSPGERTVEVLQLKGTAYELFGLYEEDVLQSPLLSGFICAVKDIFEE